MIDAVTVERFRGLKYLEVQGFGRVNLIIGKNDCGKTALMESLWLGSDADSFSYALLYLQGLRAPNVDESDFDRFWLPVFWNHDAARGIKIDTRFVNGIPAQVELRKADSTSVIIADSGASGKGALESGRSRKLGWSLKQRVLTESGMSEGTVASTGQGLTLPPAGRASTALWIRPSRDITEVDIRSFSKLKQSGREAQLLEVLQVVDPSILAIDLLAPSGETAEVYVRVGPGAPLLPISMMGEGLQRSFEIGVSAVAGEVERMFVDEIDNGLHHSVLEPLWNWLAVLSQRRNLQIFATTHSEECIQAACRAFTAANDEGLRVIRLDRHEDKTVATVYDRALVEAATQMDVEIRG